MAWLLSNNRAKKTETERKRERERDRERQRERNTTREGEELHSCLRTGWGQTFRGQTTERGNEERVPVAKYVWG